MLSGRGRGVGGQEGVAAAAQIDRVRRAPSPRRLRRRRSRCAASYLPSIGSPPQSFPEPMFVVLLVPLKPGRKNGILFCSWRLLRIESELSSRAPPAATPTEMRAEHGSFERRGEAPWPTLRGGSQTPNVEITSASGAGRPGPTGCDRPARGGSSRVPRHASAAAHRPWLPPPPTSTPSRAGSSTLVRARRRRPETGVSSRGQRVRHRRGRRQTGPLRRRTGCRVRRTRRRPRVRRARRARSEPEKAVPPPRLTATRSS